MTLRIVYIHYHLKPGGVTTVIKDQINAVKHNCDTLVLTSQKLQKNIGTEVFPIKQLDYESNLDHLIKAEELAEIIIKSIKKKWNNGCDIIHVHNPTLAKNKNLLRALKIITQQEQKLLLQIHDFPEDGRPKLYYKEGYPKNVHYCVINSRDYNILLKSGLKKEGLHLIPNKIVPFNFNKTKNNGYILYPVRGIRRKNIGEFILLSLFINEQNPIGITLPPNSKFDKVIYEKWQNFVEQNNINIEFELGLKNDFYELMKNSKFIITSSINEGFGFTFLEPWTGGKLVFGRNLPQITKDFYQNGLILNHLYNNFFIPLDLFNIKSFYSRWEKIIKKSAKYLNYDLDNKKIKNAFQKITENNIIDFALLDERAQTESLNKIIYSNKIKNSIKELNTWLIDINFLYDKELIQHNNKIVRKYYGQLNYKNRLLEIYNKVKKVTPKHKINKKVIINNFFNIDQFSLLKWKIN